MTQATIESQAPFAGAHADVLTRAAAAGTESLSDIRRAAFDHFAAQGVPTLKHEDWRYTDLRELTKTDFALTEAAAKVTAEDIAPFLIPNLDTHLMVFVDGHYRENLSRIDEHPEGTAIGTITEALTKGCTGLTDYLGKQIDTQTDAMSALNTALMEDGAAIYLKPGKTIDKPIHVLSVATERQQRRHDPPAQPHRRRGGRLRHRPRTLRHHRR